MVVRKFAWPLLLSAALLAGCSNSSDEPSTGATGLLQSCDVADSEPVTVELDTHDYSRDPALTTLDGTLVVLERYPNGYPRQLGIAVDPTPDTVWQIGGKEYVWLMEGSLTRRLIPHAGDEVRAHGVIRAGHSFLRVLALRSYELAAEAVSLPVSQTVVADKSIEGTVEVLERDATGQPLRLGISRGDCLAVALADTGKSRELMYRIGRLMRVDGVMSGEDTLIATAYAALEDNPAVSPGDGFRLSFLAGGLDETGQFMGGVEVDALQAFDGKIFAGTSYSQNTQQESPDPAPPGSQILVLDSASGRWRVDFVVPDGTNGARSKMKFLDRVRFETDYTGKPLSPAVEMLAAVSGNGDLYLRSAGEPATWHATGIADVVRAASDPGRRPDARSLVSHTDTASGIAYLFAGVGIGRRSGAGGGIYRGAYDPSLPGLIRWAPLPELPIADGPRPMGLATIDGGVYASVGPQLLRRIDGVEPAWEEVLNYVNPFRPDSVRRAAEIRGPDGGRHVLVGIENVAGAVVRVDPAAGDSVTEEFSVNDAFPGTSYSIVAYNGPAARTLDNGQQVVLLGLEMNRVRSNPEPAPEPFDLGGHYEFTDGLFLLRTPEGDYKLQRIGDPTLEVAPPLVAPRTILTHSPFPGEEGVIYLGGFDHNGNLSHNTGWIYKGHIDDLLASAVSLPLPEAEPGND